MYHQPIILQSQRLYRGLPEPSNGYPERSVLCTLLKRETPFTGSAPTLFLLDKSSCSGGGQPCRRAVCADGKVVGRVDADALSQAHLGSAAFRHLFGARIILSAIRSVLASRVEPNHKAFLCGS